jgi:hypothetical protein
LFDPKRIVGKAFDVEILFGRRKDLLLEMGNAAGQNESETSIRRATLHASNAALYLIAKTNWSNQTSTTAHH